MAKMYYDKDANLDVLKNKTVAVIGYGAQGRAQSLNLRDSGIKVIVSEIESSPNYAIAVKDGFTPVSAEEAAKQGDIIQILTQDHVQAKLYETCIKKHLTKGKALCFSHGFNIRFGQIVPPEGVDVFMIAPKGPGTLVRSQYEEGKGVPALVAVEKNDSGKAFDIALAYAKAIGGTRAGVLETTFKEETETDLFGEQAVLCGGASALVQAGFEVLVEAGYQPEIAYFECLHELKLITDLFFSKGISGMRYVVSDTAEYGDYSRGPRIVSPAVKAEMKKILAEVQSGAFAQEWIKENETGRKNFEKARKDGENHQIEKVGAELRKMMPWTQE
jgi:ketol-acid reductoisomerase